MNGMYVPRLWMYTPYLASYKNVISQEEEPVAIVEVEVDVSAHFHQSYPISHTDVTICTVDFIIYLPNERDTSMQF